VAENGNELLALLFRTYADAAILNSPETAHVVVDGQSLVSANAIPGVSVTGRHEDGVIVAEIAVAPGVEVHNPIHTCVGIMQPEGDQHLRLVVRLVSHCLFPFARRVRHEMEARVDLAAGAELDYSEGHVHGPYGGVTVIPRSIVRVGPGARFRSDFHLIQGRAGAVELYVRVEVDEGGVAEITARVAGSGSDRISLRDELVLAGREARGLIKTRVALSGEARAEVLGITRGQAAGARGHMDCMELVRDHAVARAEPIVDVSHPQAKVTHEAAVGTVDQKQLDTLMAHGLSPEAAVDLIVTGLLR
jgi:Fe-S cluster assembly scaffold protein SufB